MKLFVLAISLFVIIFSLQADIQCKSTESLISIDSKEVVESKIDSSSNSLIKTILKSVNIKSFRESRQQAYLDNIVQ